MRSFIFSLALAVAVLGQTGQTTGADTSNEIAAQQVAKNLKQSGRLKDYRVGVKYEDGVAWLLGTVTSEQQKRMAEQIARQSAGVQHVVSKLEIELPTKATGDRNVRVASNRRPRSNMPVPYARTGEPGRAVQPANYNRQAQFCPGGGCAPGAGGGMGPAPMGPQPPAAVGQSVSYDNPQMPNYAWPSYAASPNYAALTYPKQYSPSAWPYIGPFYPYPQVPLGWRKVTLEWDDGWWFLDFKDCKHCK